jgi:uncharacterized lipoprotein YehR (DUF1307 family)
MIRKITQISFAIIIALLLVSCKNTKQKIQEHVNVYNNTAEFFTGKNIVWTTAKAFLADNKIEIRIVTDLEQNESSKLVSNQEFTEVLAEMIKDDKISKDLIEEGVLFDVYFLADNSTILAQKLIGKQELAVLEGNNSVGGADEKVTAQP